MNRIGQKGRVCHRWWLRGHRPPGLADKRFSYASIFAAVEPATGADFCLVLPTVSTAAMRVFLQGFSASLAPDTHAVLVLDGAGWHGSRDRFCQASRQAVRLAVRAIAGSLRDQRGGNWVWTVWSAAPPP